MLWQKASGAGSVPTPLGTTTRTLFAAAAGADALVSIDADDPTTLAILDSVTGSEFGEASDVARDGDTVFVVSIFAQTLVAVDVSDPSAMTIASTIPDSSVYRAHRIALNAPNSVAYTLGQSTGLFATTDISDPSNMALLGVLTGLGTRTADFDVDLTLNIAYISHTDSGTITAVDISNASSLSITSSLTVADLAGAYGVAHDPTTSITYVTSSAAGGHFLTALDTSTPSAMAVEGTLTDPAADQGYGVAVDPANSVAYVGADGTLVSVDITTPSAMTVLDTLALAGGYYLWLDADNQVLYVGQGSDPTLPGSSGNGVVAVDVSDPSLMSIVDTESTAPLSGVRGIIG